MDQIIQIGKKNIGHDQPCFIIAEAGVNHNGDLGTAKKMIDCAADAGTDAVKFQTFKADSLVTKDADKADYQKCNDSCTQYEMLKKLELTNREFISLSKYATKKGIIFLSTPFDKKSVDLLEKINVPAYKISSGELTNHPLLHDIACRKKPVILSTGMATISEIGESLSVLKKSGAHDIILLHCTTDYPVNFEEVNLRAINTIRCAFKYPTGFSDHSTGIIASVAAVAMGACVIEKHFTLDKLMDGPDHKASLDPDELKELIQSIRNIEKAFGTGIKEPSPCEEKVKTVARKSIVAKLNLKQGTVINSSMLDLKRPGTGLEPKYLNMIIGKQLKKDLVKDEIIIWEYLG
jgi:N-acetylneuraminate synthase/N,N'-diacetyllegionaminate synthase